jgi:hypothetical protein
MLFATKHVKSPPNQLTETTMTTATKSTATKSTAKPTPASKAPDAIALLTADHQEVSDLFDEYEKT